jgi:hypothetical protein
MNVETGDRAPSFMRPNAQMRGEGVAGPQPMSTAVHWSPNKFWRSNSIFTQWQRFSDLVFNCISWCKAFELFLGLDMFISKVTFECYMM